MYVRLRDIANTTALPFCDEYKPDGAHRESFPCYLKGTVAFDDFSDANLARLMWFQETHSDDLRCTDVVCCGIRRELDIVLGS